MSILLSCMCDSIAVKLSEKGCQSLTEIHEASSNCVNASIAHALFCSIVYVVFICVIGFLLLKLIEHIAKGIAGWRKRVWELEDKNLKQKSDLLDKKLEFLKEFCYETKEKDLKKNLKRIDDPGVVKYLAELEKALSKGIKEER